MSPAVVGCEGLQLSVSEVQTFREAFGQQLIFFVSFVYPKLDQFRALTVVSKSRGVGRLI